MFWALSISTNPKQLLLANAILLLISAEALLSAVINVPAGKKSNQVQKVPI